jgi:hypothetical protein
MPFFNDINAKGDDSLCTSCEGRRGGTRQRDTLYLFPRWKIKCLINLHIIKKNVFVSLYDFYTHNETKNIFAFISLYENYLCTYPLHDTTFAIKTRSKAITAGKQCILIVRTCWLCYELVAFKPIKFNQEAVKCHKHQPLLRADTAVNLILSSRTFYI